MKMHVIDIHQIVISKCNFLARAVDAVGEGNMSDAEAWRRRTS
jgi:hypothetical protein